MSRRSVRKGKAWERELAQLVSDATGRDVKRRLTEAREGNEGDLETDGLPIAVQAKVGKRPQIYNALREAEEAAEGTDRLPVALVRRNSPGGGLPPTDMAVLPLAAFLRLLSGFLEAEG